MRISSVILNKKSIKRSNDILWPLSDCNSSIVAKRPNREWFPDLILLLMEEPVTLPMMWNLLVWPHVKKFHQELEMLELHAWELSSDCREADYSEDFATQVASQVRKILSFPIPSRVINILPLVLWQESHSK